MRSILRPGMLLAVLLPALLTTGPRWDVFSQETASAPTWVVTGQVLDAASGEPLPGAVVCHRQSTVSDEEGRFRFEIPAEDKPVIWISAKADGHQGRGLKWNAGTDNGRPVTIRLPRALQLRGRVVDEVGEPVGGAEVRVRMADRDDLWDEKPVSIYTTSSTGGFRSRDFRVTGYELRVEAEGYAVAFLRVGAEEAHEPLEVVLHRGALLTGRVMSPEGSPLPDARLLLAATPDDPGRWASARREVLFETTTERSGGFRFPRLPKMKLDLEATAPGWAPTRLPSVEIPPDGALDLGEIRLQPAVSLEGRVEDPQGRPIPDAAVASEREHSTESRPLAALPAVATDERGRFAIDGLRTGEALQLEVKRQGYLGASVNAFASASTPVKIVLTPEARISGVVMWPDGKPAAEVFLRGALRTKPDTSAREIYGRADTEGRFVLDGLREGQVSLVAVTASGQGDWSSIPKSFPVAQGAQLDAGRLVLEPAGEVSGRVLDPTGQPRPDARVVLRRRTKEGAAIEDSWRTDVGGGFVFGSIAPGPWEISVYANGGRAQTRDIEVRPGQQWIELDLPADERLRISGRVVDAEGNPVASSDLFYDREGGAGGITGTGADGRFSLAWRVEPGVYRLAASAPGWAKTELEQPVILEDRPIEGIEIRLHRGASLSGRLTGIETSQLGRVSVEATIQSPTDYQQVTGEVGFDGRYRIVGLSPGTWKIRARGPDGLLAVEEVVVGVEDGALSRDLRFVPGETLRGRVLLNGEPVAGLELHLRTEPSHVDHRTVTDGGGRFEFTGLEPGHYVLGGIDRATGLQVQREVEIPTADELLLASDATVVRGRVLGAEGEGAPVPGVSVLLSPLDPGALGNGVATDERGRFAATVSPGHFRLALSHPEAGARVIEFEAEGPDLDLGDLVLAPGGALNLELRWNVPSPPEPSPSERGPGDEKLGLQALLLAGSNRGPVVERFVMVEPGKPVRLEGLPPGSWRLVLFSWRTGVASLPVTVSEGITPKPLVVTLPPPTAVRVRIPALGADSDSAQPAELVVRDAQGERFPVPVFVQGESPSAPVNGFGDPTALVAGDEVVIALLPPGTWTVEVTAGDGRHWRGKVTTRPEEVAELDLE